MAGGVRVELSGVEAAEASLGRVAALGLNPQPIFDAIGMAMVASQQRRFELGVEPDGTPWMQSWRARQTGGKTLIDTGMLLSRLTHNADAQGVEWGFNDRRAPTLHFGAVIRPATKRALAFTGADGHLVFAASVVIPARPMVGTDAEDIAEIEAIVTDHIEAAGGEAGP